MNLVLAIETATPFGGVAVYGRREGVITEIRQSVRATHSERLMPMIDRALEEAGLGLRDLDLLAVSIGPGSFTGLRIGLGAVKGLCYATGLPAVGVPTLEALAANLPFSSLPVCPLLDARKGELYSALYRPGEKGAEVLLDEAPRSPERLVRELSEHAAADGGLVVLGPGVPLAVERLREALGREALHECPGHLAMPMPSSVARLAMERASVGEVCTDAASLVPRYLRKSEAELKFGTPE